jgi:trypsin
VLTVSLTSLLSVPDGVSAVTYGDPVESPQVDFPEVVPIWVGGKTLCTGTLIQQQVVLTAAHCIYGEPGPFQISVGAKTLNSGSLIDVDATWYHPRYDASFSQNDIALLHLKTSANVSRLGVLPPAKLKTLGKKFLIVGWGRDQNGLVTGKLNRLTLNDQTIAAKRDFKGYYNPKTMVGAGRYFADEVLYGGGCTGDSGGPLYLGAAGASRTVIGLTSFGARGCVDYKPTIFTRVDFYVSEIYEGIALLKSRSVTTPIPTGGATPVGVGPTTTTTTAPLAPLTVRFLTGSYDTTGQGIDGRFVTNLVSPNFVKKICFVVNMKPFPEYDGGDLYFNYQKRTQSGGAGCYENVTYGGQVDWTLFRVRCSASSVVYATIYDSIGRSVVTPYLTAAGTNCRRGDMSTYGVSAKEWSTTTEINLKINTEKETNSVTKVCLTVTMNGTPYSSITSGRNGWNDIGGGCVSPTRRVDYWDYESSSMIQNPSGMQDWIVSVTVHTSDGQVKTASSIGYSS